MARRRALLLVILLALSTLGAAPARAADPLVADAGDSRIAYNGEPLALAGAAFGGAPPYTLAWSWDGDPARIDGSTFVTAGLAPQDVVLTLTVTDADGAVATDSVRHRVDLAPVLVRRNVTIPTPGVPDELVGESLDERPVFFTVSSGLARFRAELTWTEDTGIGYDLDLEMVDPSGNEVSNGQGATSQKPERVTIESPAVGRWTARILPFASGPTTATLVVQGFPQGALPTLSLGGPYAFGSADAQRLVATASPGATVAWDLDGDGRFETPGAEVQSALPVGVHLVRARATDEAGYEVSGAARVHVREAETILRLRCGGDPTTPYWAMEFTSSKGSCWIHGGHHTFFLGDRVFSLRALAGWVFTVEQQLSPPTEYNVDQPGTTPMHVEVSTDGLTWTEVGHGAYRFAGFEQRQRVDIALQSAGEPFRFLRVREPLSAAQGLSGYLDHSEIDVEADVLAESPAPPASVTGSRALSCLTDIMEDFFLTHPCWFGGIDRWDAASFWHTYPLGDGARLDRIRGEAVVAPWRLDDWNQGNATANATGIAIYVQTSVDGVQWRDVALVQGAFGAPMAFDVALDGEEARFVRLFPEYHARFDQTAQFAPNHHAKGYFLSSSLVVDGILPA